MRAHIILVITIIYAWRLWKVKKQFWFDQMIIGTTFRDVFTTRSTVILQQDFNKQYIPSIIHFYKKIIKNNTFLTYVKIIILPTLDFIIEFIWRCDYN